MEEEVNYFGMKMGRGGLFVPNAQKDNFIGIGYHKIKSDLKWMLEEEDKTIITEKLKEMYRKAYPADSENAVSINCGQIIRFVKELKVKDIVLVRNPHHGTILFGLVDRIYDYKEDWGDSCKYQHRKKVIWKKEIDKDKLSQKLKYSLGSQLTVFSLRKYKDEIKELLGEKPSQKEKEERIITGKELRKLILNRIYELNGKDFEYFVTNLLAQMGYDAVTTKLVGDHGVDIIGTLNAEGLTQITLRIQAKRVNNTIGNDEVLKIRGTLSTDEHGAIITTSTFTKSAKEEAEEDNKKPIQLIDGEQLVDMILNYYDELDERYKNLLKLKKKEIPTDEQFFTNE